MNLLQRLFGKTKPDPKVKSTPKSGKAKTGTGKVKKAKSPVPVIDAATATPPPANSQPMDEATATILRNIEAKRGHDPMIGVKVCATEVLNRLILAMRDPKGVHSESLLCALGALGGFACQMTARAQGLKLTEVKTDSGKVFWFGEAVNKPLAESPTSVLALTMGAASALGVERSPDLQDILKHTIDALGTNTYGIPRLPEAHMPRDLPMNYALALWPVLIPTIKMFCKNPAEWPIVFGYAIQQVMKQSKDALDPAIATLIVMESAVPASKIDPGPDVSNMI